MTMFTIEDRVRESNRIEGILRDPTPQELSAHVKLMAVNQMTLDDLIAFVKAYQPDAILRDRYGLNVRVGNHLPPKGGPVIPTLAVGIIWKANLNPGLAWKIHIAYETVHPFTDGNGRSGRALWYWCMQKSGQDRLANLGFLHAMYYQTLDASRNFDFIKP